MYTGLFTSKFIRRSLLPELGSVSENASANIDCPSPGVAVHWNRTGLATVPGLIGPISSEATKVLPAAEEPWWNNDTTTVPAAEPVLATTILAECVAFSTNMFTPDCIEPAPSKVKELILKSGELLAPVESFAELNGATIGATNNNSITAAIVDLPRLSRYFTSTRRFKTIDVDFLALLLPLSK